MKICVCLKQVPNSEAPVHLDQDKCWISEQDSRFETNEADQYALEQALSIKESDGAEVVVLSLGPQRVLQTLKEALAKGADRAIHVVEDDYFRLDPLQLATMLTKAMDDEQFDLLLTGLQSNDQGYGQTAVVMAQLLSLPHASIIIEMKLEKQNVRVRRELESGWSQWLQMTLPCVLSIQSGINKPRYASMKGILAAKKKPIATFTGADLLPEHLGPSQTMQKIYFPEKLKQTEMLSSQGEALATELLQKLNVS